MQPDLSAFMRLQRNTRWVAPLDVVSRTLKLRAVTLVQIQKSVSGMSASERLVLMAYLKHLGRVDSPAHQKSLDDAADRMAAGEKVNRTQLINLHETLKAGGV